MINTYLLGCLAVLLLIPLSCFIEYKLTKCLEITVKEILYILGLILLSWFGFGMSIVAILYTIIDDHGDKIIFKKRAA